LCTDAVQPLPPLAGDESNQTAGLTFDERPPLSAFVPLGHETLSVPFDFAPSDDDALVTSVRPGASVKPAQIALVVAEELDGTT
jgi:hypothetical protein